MGEYEDIATMRARMAGLVHEEADLVARAVELSRAGGQGATVNALFARVQMLQVERSSLKNAIGNLLGVQRLHVASEVWKPGVYLYRREVGDEPVRVRVAQGPLGLQVAAPGSRRPVTLETMEGTFEGPVRADASGDH